MGSHNSRMGWVRPNVCSMAFICSAVALALTFVGMMCAVTGMAILPKCRYGMPECYFHVTNCAYTDNEGKSEGCVDVLKMRAIEGSSDYSAEQLAIPILAGGVIGARSVEWVASATKLGGIICVIATVQASARSVEGVR